MRAAIYARVSTTEQANTNGSLDMQVEQCTAFIQSKGWKVEAIFKEDYTGTEYERPEMNILRELAKRKLIDVIVIKKTDRFARDEAAYILLERYFQQYNVKLWSVEEGEFSVGVINKYLAAIQRARAEDEVAVFKARSTEARHNYKLQGAVGAQGRCKYGYDKVGKKAQARYVIKEDEAAIVRLIFQLYLERFTQEQIAEQLNKMNVPVPSLSRKMGGAKTEIWTRRRINFIIENAEVYHGTLTAYERDPDRRMGIPIPAIIDDATYQQVLYLRSQTRFRARRDWALETTYLLSGKLQCTCGYSYGKDWFRNPHGRVYTYYRCGNTTRSIPENQCTVNRFRADIADALVWDLVVNLLTDPRATYARYKKQQNEEKALLRNAQKRIKAINDLLDELHTEKERIMVLFRKGIADEEYLDTNVQIIDRQKQKLLAEQQKMEDTIATFQASTIQLDELERIAASVRGKLEVITDADKIKVLDKLRILVTAAKEDGTIVLYVSVLGTTPERITLVGVNDVSARIHALPAR